MDPSSSDHMRVYHRCADVGVSEQFLHGAYVRTVLQHVRGERVPERVHRAESGDTGIADGLFYRTLDGRFMEMEPHLCPRNRVVRSARSREEELPTEFGRRRRIFAVQRIGQHRRSESFGQVLTVDEAHLVTLHPERFHE